MGLLSGETRSKELALTETLNGRRISIEWPGNGGLVCQATAVRQPDAEERKQSPSLKWIITDNNGSFIPVFEKTKIRLI
ncbi:MAG: hypothetical protein MUC28_02035 [Planctomycetes bacterium]|nr:hypothetical protein [Planctomycetota bacterium]